MRWSQKLRKCMEKRSNRDKTTSPCYLTTDMITAPNTTMMAPITMDMVTRSTSLRNIAAKTRMNKGTVLEIGDMMITFPKNNAYVFDIVAIAEPIPAHM